MAGDYEKKIRGVEIKLEYGIAYVSMWGTALNYSNVVHP